jgi:Fusaric acid resistance protein-like
METVQMHNGRTINSGLSRFGQSVAVSTLLAISCLISYSIATNILSREYFVSYDDEMLGGMWAAIATIFVFRQSYDRSVRAALSRTSATFLSFVLSLAYFLFFPFHVLGMAIVIGISSIILTVARRSEDIITSGITTAVVFVVAGISPGHAWMQPILRLADTAIGILVGLGASWMSVAMGLNAFRKEARTISGR